MLFYFIRVGWVYRILFFGNFLKKKVKYKWKNIKVKID